MTEPAAPHPSDSERTGYADRAAQYCGGCPHQAIAHGYRERPKPIPAGRCHSGSCPCDQFTPRPSDSERTPRTDYDDPALYDFDGMMPQCGYVVHAAHCRLDARHGGLHSPGRLPAIEAESERVNLDVERLDRDLRSHFGELLSPNEYAAIRSIVRARLNYAARLSPSTGKLPEQPNQDAGGIPYWPDAPEPADLTELRFRTEAER